MLTENLPENQTVCLCGSTRHKKDFDILARVLALRGNVVLRPDIYSKVDGVVLSAEDTEILHAVHLRKIDMADIVIVVTPTFNELIGDSTKSEMQYAQKTGKPVFTTTQLAEK